MIEQYNIFRKKFQQIVYKKGLIKVSEDKIKCLSRWDKNGSHQKAINEEIERLKIHRKEFKDSMIGKNYEEWKKISIRLSALKFRMKKQQEGSAKQQYYVIEISQTIEKFYPSAAFPKLTENA